MAWAINLRSDDTSADSIRSLWRRFAALEKAPSMQNLNYPPHLTLAVYDQRPENLFEVFDRVFDGQTRQVVTFNRLGVFRTATALVVYAAPVESDWLQTLHRQLHHMLGAQLCRPNYRPDRWVPHCSLATAIDPAQEHALLNLLDQSMPPVELTITTADCASFLPVAVIREQPLN